MNIDLASPLVRQASRRYHAPAPRVARATSSLRPRHDRRIARPSPCNQVTDNVAFQRPRIPIGTADNKIGGRLDAVLRHSQITQRSGILTLMLVGPLSAPGATKPKAEAVSASNPLLLADRLIGRIASCSPASPGKVGPRVNPPNWAAGISAGLSPPNNPLIMPLIGPGIKLRIAFSTSCALLFMKLITASIADVNTPATLAPRPCVSLSTRTLLCAVQQRARARFSPSSPESLPRISPRVAVATPSPPLRPRCSSVCGRRSIPYGVD